MKDSTEPAATEGAETPPAGPKTWGWVRRVSFRFLLIYTVLYVLQDQMSLPFSLVTTVSLTFTRLELPGSEAAASVTGAMGNAMGWVDNVWEDIVTFVAANFPGIHTNVERVASGSGDTTFDWFSVLTVLLFAVSGGALWSLIDRRPRRHWRLLPAWRIGIRYFLAYTMLGYGFVKFFPLQFPDPFPARLVQTYGDSSPMGLLWTFMGTSPIYQSFSGLAEVLGGLLLLFRRTASLGALVTFAVMTHVALLNYCYDVPVKLLSTHMVLFALVLAALDGRRLVRVLVLHRPTAAAPLPAPFRGRWWPVVTYPVKIVFISSLLFIAISSNLQLLETRGPDRTLPPLYGLYEVETFERSGEVVPPLTTDTTRWRYAIVRFPGTLNLRVMDGSRSGYQLATDEEAMTVTLTRGQPPVSSVLEYERPSPGMLVFHGTLEGQEVRIEMRERTAADFEYTSRGFHWISEVPYNR